MAEVVAPWLDGGGGWGGNGIVDSCGKDVEAAAVGPGGRGVHEPCDGGAVGGWPPWPSMVALCPLPCVPVVDGRNDGWMDGWMDDGVGHPQYNR